MNRFILIVGFFTFLTAEKCDNPKTSVVNLTFTRTSSYCGGAAPSELMLSELATPTSLNGTMLYVYDNNVSCIDSFMAKGDSTFKTALLNGSYSIRLVPKVENILGDSEKRENCVKEFKQRSLKTLEVTSDTTVTLNLHFSCNPCYPPPP